MRKISFFIVISILLCSLNSCALREKEYIPCLDILTAMIEGEIGLPAGKHYSYEYDEGEEGYISDSLCAALFGNGSYPEEAEGWLDMAFFIPTASHPCEFTVIYCNSPDSCEDTASLLCRRLGILRSAWEDDPLKKYVDNAAVCIIGNYVLLIVSSDTPTAQKIASEAIG